MSHSDITSVRVNVKQCVSADRLHGGYSIENITVWSLNVKHSQINVGYILDTYLHTLTENYTVQTVELKFRIFFFEKMIFNT